MLPAQSPADLLQPCPAAIHQFGEVHMTFEVEKSIEILQRTPYVLSALLGD